jgi:DNA-binding NarL/FixJ family response regulator
VVLLADRPTSGHCQQTLTAGAVCLRKDAGVHEILAAVHDAAGERRSPAASGACVPAGPSGSARSLTPREAEVRVRLSLGRSYAQIAEELHISFETVHTHCQHIYRKLCITGRRELQWIESQARSEQRSSSTLSDPRRPSSALSPFVTQTSPILVTSTLLTTGM